jgi:hypothetical protein
MKKAILDGKNIIKATEISQGGLCIDNLQQLCWRLSAEGIQLSSGKIEKRMGNQDQIASAEGYGIEENTRQRTDKGTARSNCHFGTITG